MLLTFVSAKDYTKRYNLIDSILLSGGLLNIKYFSTKALITG